MGLCTRCFAGYLGLFFVAAFFRTELKYGKRIVLGAVVFSLALVDPLVQLVTDYISTNTVRGLTGFAGGFGIALMTLPVCHNRTKETRNESIFRRYLSSDFCKRLFRRGDDSRKYDYSGAGD
jgi:uncharacterized membrane protein